MHLHSRCAFSLVFALVLCAQLFTMSPLKAQKRPQVQAELFSTVSSDDFQAFWLVTNRHGKYDELSANSGLSLGVFTRFEQGKYLDYEYGFEGVFRGSQNSTVYAHQWYLNFRASVFTLKLGKQEERIGSNYHRLSSGSMVMSGNANPITKITLAVEDYQPVPFTGGWFAYKGRFSHGWLEEDRFVTDAFYHDKALYLKFGGELPFQLHGGLAHFAQWGGDSPDRGNLPSSFSDFFDVILGQEGNSSAPLTEQINVLGNHLGMWDFGAEYDFGKAGKLFAYWHHYYELRSSFLFRSIGDGFWGAGMKDMQVGPIRGFVLEFIKTKNQNGPGLSDPTPQFPDEEANFGFRFNGRQNYYNNGVYLSGWTYEDRNLGSPLLLNSTQLNETIPGAPEFRSFFVSTRIEGLHGAVEGVIPGSSTMVIFKTTYVKHYGTYQDFNATFGDLWGTRLPGVDLTQYTFFPALSQWYFFLGGQRSLGLVPGDRLQLGLAYDTGELNNNIGLSVGYTLSF